MSAGISRDEWLSALGESMPQHDPSAVTVAELSRLLGVADSTARVRIRKLLKEQKAIRTAKLMPDSGGAMRRVTAYRLVAPKKGKR